MIKMNGYRLFLLIFMMASFTLLTGFQRPDIDKAALAEKQIVAANVQKARSKHKNLVKRQGKKDKHSVAIADSAPAKDAEQKSLDLSLPFKADEKNWFESEQGRAVQKESLTIFTHQKKKSQPVYLDGEMLMSQEPEADKRKSLDGAGIVITLKK
jgi:hypothetical protein